MSREHFQPEITRDPEEQKRLRAHLDEVDAAAYNANRQTLARTVGRVDAARFHKLAAAAAQARADWVSFALDVSQKSAPSRDDVTRLAALRTAFEELTEAYEATRRMVERGYLCYLDHGPNAMVR